MDIAEAAYRVETIFVVRDGDLYTAAIPMVHGSCQVRVNGEIVASPDYGKHTLVSTLGVPVIELWNTMSVPELYESLVEGQPDMSVLDWTEHNTRLLARSHKDEQGQHWADIEDEVAYARFSRTYRVRNRTETRRARNLLYQVVPKTPQEPFIAPKRLMGGDDMSYMSSIATYDRPGYLVERITTRLAALGLARKTGLGHSGPRDYSLFDHNDKVALYLPGGARHEVSARCMTERYEVVSEAKRADRDMVDGWIATWSRDIETPVNAAEIRADIEAIMDVARTLQVKVGSQDGARQMAARLRALVAKVSPPIEPEAGQPGAGQDEPMRGPGRR